MDRDVFVGRDHELGVLERHLADARATDGGLVLVDGEPGMGKTALGHELTRRARAAGMVTCWGACWEGEGAPAYRPWAQILRGLGAAPDRLLAPDGETRFRLFDEVVGLLRAAAAGDGMLVVLDDLHWADVPSMRLLQVLASEVAGCRLVVVGLYRTGEVYPHAELARVLRAIRRERSTTGMRLGGLLPGEVEQLATRTLDRPPTDALLRAVERRAEGNPLFVLELVRLAATPGAADRSLPADVREVIARRLDRMPEATRRVLRQASVLGREFSVSLLADVAGAPASDIVDLLEEAVAQDLVVAGDGHALRFAHALTQEVAYGELPGGERRQLHQRAAEAMEAGHRQDADLFLDALAHHLRQAATLGGAERALEATLRAARRANDQLAYEHAAFQYGQALELLPLLPRAPVTRHGLLLELARCQFRAGAVADAWTSCRAAADLGRTAGDVVAVAEAAVVIRGLRHDPVCEEIHALCREALTLLRGRDPVLEARLLGQLAVTASPFAGRAEPGLSERALVAAEATGDPDARLLALQARHADLLNPRYAHERLSLGERAVQLGRESGRHDYAVWGHTWRIDAFFELSRRVQLDTELAAFAGVVGHLREPLSLWRLTMIQASLAMLEGRYAEASALADQALAIGRRGGHQEADALHMVFLDHLAPQIGGSLEEVETYVRRFVRNGPFLARGWLASVLVNMGRLDEAAEVWASVVPRLDSFPPYADEWLINLTSSADLCIRLNRPELAPGLYAELLPFADRQAIGGAHTPSDGPVALYLGKLACVLEDWAAADTHLQMSLHLSAAMCSPPFEAMTRVEIARLLLARGLSAGIREADAHLEAAIQTANRLGMTPLAAEATGLLTGLRRGRSSPLSPREHEIAALVAEGLSNRLIATRLHLSERTVENHVRSIFNKLGFDSRARVAAWFASSRHRD